ncbi:nucleolar protein 7 [Dunckerocampus dactyliophorus]|uniref:nucleolar protein 7 n=1 Tax=Dunckerocampus dactyliophorus TaxID=161453 RepID=UPI002405B187|nr:nucleolar protein 7 [Dunckerocampus dactyliophorus]
MATRKRGRLAGSSKVQHHEAAMKTFGVEFHSSDDEAPEEMTFEDSRAEALRSAKQALEIARREKELLREKRKKRQELFKEQKKRKLLSVKVLESDSARKSTSEDEGPDVPVAFQDEEHHKDKKDKKMTKQRNEQKLGRCRNLEGNCNVMTVKPRELVSFQQKTAEDFIQSRLYGPGSRRTTSNQLLSLHNKRATNKSAAVQFVKKEWAQKEKSKAEKMKRRRLQKHIPSS